MPTQSKDQKLKNIFRANSNGRDEKPENNLETNPEVNLESRLQNLNESVDKLSRQMQNANSFWRNAVLSIIRGLTFSLGATLIFGLAIAILVVFIQSIDYVPIINEIFNSESIRELIEQFSQ
jgi:hypothetical protein